MPAWLEAVNPFELRSDQGRVAIEFEPSLPTAYVCVEQGTPFNFAIHGALQTFATSAGDAGDGALDAGAVASRDAAAGSPWAGLDAEATFVVSVEADPIQPVASKITFTSWVQDVVRESTRSELQAATGLDVGAPDEYQRFWWTWQGTMTRPEPSAEWQLKSELLVSSLSAAESAAVDQVTAQGGPGVGIGVREDGLAELPGDPILHATAP